MYIQFQTGAKVGYLNALETEEFWGGSNRRVLTFTCDTEEVGVDQLNAILSEKGNLETLELVNEELGVSNIYEGYTIKMNVGLTRELQAAETPEAPAQYVDRLVFKLAKPTFIEAQLARLGIG